MCRRCIIYIKVFLWRSCAVCDGGFRQVVAWLQTESTTLVTVCDKSAKVDQHHDQLEATHRKDPALTLSRTPWWVPKSHPSYLHAERGEIHAKSVHQSAGLVSARLDDLGCANDSFDFQADSNAPITLRTRHFITNRLLARRQFVIDVLHPSRPNVAKAELQEKLAGLYKTHKDRVVTFGFRTQFGGGRSTGFALIYDDEASQKKFEPRYRLVRVSSA